MSAWPTHPRTWHVGTQDLLIRNLVLSRIEAVIVKVLPRLCAELNVGDASHVIPAPGCGGRDMGVVIVIHTEIRKWNWFQWENGHFACKLT